MTKTFKLLETTSGRFALVEITPTRRQKAITGTETKKRKRTSDRVSSAKNTTKKFSHRLCDQSIENPVKQFIKEDAGFLAAHKNEVVTDLLDTSNESEDGVCIIQTHVSGERISMIVDTGSELTLMPERCYNRILDKTNVSVNVWPANDFNIYGITGKNKLNILKKAKIDVDFFDGKKIPTKFLIAKNLDIGTSPILGNDFLAKYNATLDYPGRELHLNFNTECIIVPFNLKRDYA